MKQTDFLQTLQGVSRTPYLFDAYVFKADDAGTCVRVVHTGDPDLEQVHYDDYSIEKLQKAGIDTSKNANSHFGNPSPEAVEKAASSIETYIENNQPL